MINSGPENERHEFEHTAQRLRWLKAIGLDPRTICDIGASDGRWARMSMEVFPLAEYFCVDPLEENKPALEKFSVEHKNIRYWTGCLGSEPTTVILNVDGDGTSILPGHVGNAYGEQRTVVVETLDSLIESGACPQPALIKLDVQGYELEVLKGGRSALKKTEAIIAEVSFFSFQKGMPDFYEVVRQMAEYGFALHDIFRLTTRPLDGAAGQADLLFLKAEHRLRSSNKWSDDSTY